MKLRTEITIDRSPTLIEHDQPVLTLGSCFAEHLGGMLKQNRFTVLDNPFGVLYNPASMLQSLQLLTRNTFPQEELVYHNEEWHSFYHHSSFSHHIKSSCLAHINSQIKKAQSFLVNTKHAILTLGTAYVYRRKGSGQIVSNCHKMPANHFEHGLLDSTEIIRCLLGIIDILRHFNPQMHIIFSVSPIRHIKDGLLGNQISKTNLLFSIQKLAAMVKNWHYFPAYEIMLDDLRDYRFYEEDLLHPNALAREYIWRKFAAAYFSGRCMETLNELKDLNRARRHKPRNPQSPMSQEFIKNQLFLIKELQQRYPYISFEEDVQHFSGMLGKD